MADVNLEIRGTNCTFEERNVGGIKFWTTNIPYGRDTIECGYIWEIRGKYRLVIKLDADPTIPPIVGYCATLKGLYEGRVAIEFPGGLDLTTDYWLNDDGGGTGGGPYKLSDYGGGYWAYGPFADLTKIGSNYELNVSSALTGGAPHNYTLVGSGPVGDYPVNQWSVSA